MIAWLTEKTTLTAKLKWCVLAAFYLFFANAAQALPSLDQALSGQAVKIGGSAFSTAPLADFYAGDEDGNEHRLWVSDDGINGIAIKLISEIEGLTDDGLDPSDYMSLLPDDWDGAATSDELNNVEIVLSSIFIKAARDMFAGRTTPSISDSDIVIKRKSLDYKGLLGRLLDESPKQVFQSLRPPHPQYAQLRQILGGYRALAKRGGWDGVEKGPTLKPGMSDERVLQLRANLKARGYSGIDGADPLVFDESLVSVVEHFQKRHGLDIDGAVGPATLGALNVSAAQRVSQLIVNLERWRWLPRKLGDRHVMVNQAGFELFMMNKGKLADRRRVIIGKPFHQTPMFSDKISYAEFNPTWTVPPSIAGKEMLPKLRKDPSYLTKRGYTLYTSWKADAPAMDPYSIDWHSVNGKRFPYKIVQGPGKNNALGNVKFIFPNKFNVYLHDTPSRQLFSRSARAFSHGCIRVHKPLEFAQKLFGLAQGLKQSKIKSMIASKQTKRIILKNKIPVHLTYFTAWIDDNGVPSFFNDVYKRDGVVSKILAGEA